MANRPPHPMGNVRVHAGEWGVGGGWCPWGVGAVRGGRRAKCARLPARLRVLGIVENQN